jgi:hypothetical protein
VRVKQLEKQAREDFRYNESLLARLVPFLGKEAVKKDVAKKEAAEREVTDEFMPQRQKDQLCATLEIEEHRGCTRAISSIASWKEGFTEDIHMYKKRGRDDIVTESANNKE